MQLQLDHEMRIASLVLTEEEVKQAVAAWVNAQGIRSKANDVNSPLVEVNAQNAQATYDGDHDTQWLTGFEVKVDRPNA